MRVSTLFPAAALLAPLAALAAPLERTIDPGSVQVLQFASVLEVFETQFYSQALKKFQPSDFVSAGFQESEIVIEQITIIQEDESVHVTAIEEILVSLGQKPPQCQYDFSSVLTDVTTMVTFAQVVENVGVGAYLGASHLVQDPRVLTAAASIVTIEARHQSILNMFMGTPPIPQPFDIPLLPNEVLAIAGSFIKGCDLGIKANVELSVTNTETITVGTSLQFSSSAFTGTPSGYFCQMLIGGVPFSLPLPMDQCVVPQGINGPVAIWITSDGQPLNGGAVDRSSNAIVAGPLMAFVQDPSMPGSMSSMFRPNQNNGASTTTTTVSPAQADSMIMSALASETASVVMDSAAASAVTLTAAVSDASAMATASDASATATASDASAMATASDASASATASDASATAIASDASATATDTSAAASSGAPGMVFSMVAVPSASSS